MRLVYSHLYYLMVVATREGVQPPYLFSFISWLTDKWQTGCRPLLTTDISLYILHVTAPVLLCTASVWMTCPIVQPKHENLYTDGFTGCGPATWIYPSVPHHLTLVDHANTVTYLILFRIFLPSYKTTAFSLLSSQCRRQHQGWLQTSKSFLIAKLLISIKYLQVVALLATVWKASVHAQKRILVSNTYLQPRKRF